MFNKKLKEKIVILEEENKRLNCVLDTYLPILNIDDELDELVKERDVMVTIINELKEKSKNKYSIVEKDEVVYADHMRIHDHIIVFENYTPNISVFTDNGWRIVASCPANLTVIQI